MENDYIYTLWDSFNTDHRICRVVLTVPVCEGNHIVIDTERVRSIYKVVKIEHHTMQSLDPKRAQDFMEAETKLFVTLTKTLPLNTNTTEGYE